jgi:hypothetical protein
MICAGEAIVNFSKLDTQIQRPIELVCEAFGDIRLGMIIIT